MANADAVAMTNDLIRGGSSLASDALAFEEGSLAGDFIGGVSEATGSLQAASSGRRLASAANASGFPKAEDVATSFETEVAVSRVAVLSFIDHAIATRDVVDVGVGSRTRRVNISFKSGLGWGRGNTGRDGGSGADGRCLSASLGDRHSQSVGV